jgi:hypothetical protein
MGNYRINLENKTIKKIKRKTRNHDNTSIQLRNVDHSHARRS